MRTVSRWLLIGLLAAIPTAGWADWIVTKDGGKFEIKGSWAQKGKMIVFTSTSGTLSSLRADRVDFDASKKATDDAAKAASEPPIPVKAEEPKPKKKSVWVLTDKDFKKSAPADGSERPTDSGKDVVVDNSKEVVPGSTAGLKLVKWERVNPTDPTTVTGVVLSGRVQNGGTDLMTDLAITANFFDDSGTLLGKFTAQPAVSRLRGGEVGDFTVTAGGVFNFTSVKFELKATGFKTRTTPPAADGTKPADAGAVPPPPPSV